MSRHSKISDTAKQGDDRRVHEGGILSVGFDFGTDTKSGSAQFWNTHQPAYPELGLIGFHWPKPTIRHPWPDQRLTVNTQGRSRMR